jgi:translation initiation factor IF-1
MRTKTNNEVENMNEITQTIAQQINAKELKFAKFTLTCDDKTNTIGILKGKKAMRIKYSEGKDLYDVTKIKIKGLCDFQEEKLEGMYCDQLKELISEHFNFEYVMHMFVRC